MAGVSAWHQSELRFLDGFQRNAVNPLNCAG
jgi:hypothetical protein